MKTLSIVTACFNEEENIEALYHEVKAVIRQTPYSYEHIFIDNCSTDQTVSILRKLANEDPNVKVIVNSRNFGHVRSPCYALLQADGDAVISIVADFQDPPHLILEFIKAWEAGYKIVAGIKEQSQESQLMMRLFRKTFYKIIASISEIPVIQNFTGFGLFDKVAIQAMRQYHDPYPYFRGLLCEIGFEVAKIPYSQPKRKQGRTKNNFLTLFDMAMLGITTYSKIPIRLITLIGGALTALNLVLLPLTITLKTLIFKELHWGFLLFHSIFFLFSLQFLVMGVLGEYILTINSRLIKRPLVIEKERINFTQNTNQKVDIIHK